MSHTSSANYTEKFIGSYLVGDDFVRFKDEYGRVDVLVQN